jgi:hypothetical protein
VSGLACFLLIGAPFFFKKICVRYHLDFILFSILFGVFSVTEATLEVQKGLVFFSYFYCLFVFYSNPVEIKATDSLPQKAQ